MSAVAAKPDLFQVAIVARAPEALNAVLRDHEIDFGCRPSVRRRDDGSLQVLALAPQVKIAALRGMKNLEISVGRNASEEGRARQKEVGQGDRFGGGKVAPRGFGEKVGGRSPC